MNDKNLYIRVYPLQEKIMRGQYLNPIKAII